MTWQPLGDRILSSPDPPHTQAFPATLLRHDIEVCWDQGLLLLQGRALRDCKVAWVAVGCCSAVSWCACSVDLLPCSA